MRTIKKVDDLIDTYPDFDGILFYGVPDEKYGEVWKLSYLEFDNAEYEENENGFKHYILFFLKNGGIELTEATLSSPALYVKNLLSSDQEGMIMKKCKQSESIIREHMYKRMKAMMKHHMKMIELMVRHKEIEDEIAKEIVNV